MPWLRHFCSATYPPRLRSRPRSPTHREDLMPWLRHFQMLQCALQAECEVDLSAPAVADCIASGVADAESAAFELWRTLFGVEVPAAPLPCPGQAHPAELAACHSPIRTHARLLAEWAAWPRSRCGGGTAQVRGGQRGGERPAAASRARLPPRGRVLPRAAADAPARVCAQRLLARGGLHRRLRAGQGPGAGARCAGAPYRGRLLP